jgi:predicted lipid-binding transport protein (Tim44 family)
VDTTFVSIDRTTIEDAQLRESMAQVSLRFQSKLITATRDSSAVIIDGSADKVVDMIDVWTFARDTSSRDPNWLLVATEAGA